MYKTTIQIKAQCPRHPLYDPAKGGQAAIRGACGQCEEIYRTFQMVLALRRQTGVTFPVPVKQDLSPKERERRREHARSLHRGTHPPPVGDNHQNTNTIESAIEHSRKMAREYKSHPGKVE